jgi:hypothetical protein
MPDIDPLPEEEDERRQITWYGTDREYRDIREQARRELMSASSWMRRVLLDRLRSDGRRKRDELSA